MKGAKSPRFRALVLAVLLPAGSWGQTARYNAAEDEAYFGPYEDGWQSGDQGGTGFGPWQLFAPTYTEGENRYAGFFLAEADREPDLAGAAVQGRAFGVFANGVGFEETVAFRPFAEPLREGDTFSFLLEFDGFSTKFDSDSAEVASVGLALRGGSRGAGIEDLARERRWVIAAVEGLSTYQVYDAEPRFNTGVFIDPEGALVSVRLREGNAYDLQIQTLGDGRIHEFSGRRLRPSERPVQSFALFNLNGGSSNLYAGGFQLSRPMEL